MARILLVGATGRIGGATAAALRARRVPFSIMIRPETGGIDQLRTDPDRVAGDVTDVESLQRAFDGFETVLSVSPFTVDIDRTGRNMVEAAKSAGVRRFVRASALGAAPDAAISLGRLHAAAEDAVRRSGLDWTILQPATFMQNYLGFAGSIRSEGAFYSSLGEGRVSIVDVRDVGDMAAAVLTEPSHTGKTYAVTGPKAISCAEIAALMSEKFGRPIRYVKVTDEQVEAAMRTSGMPAPLVRMVGELTGISRAGHAATVSSDVERVLKRRPYSFTDFLDANKAGFGVTA